MTIGSPSGSGATQNDIADGTDQSDGRWRTFADTGLYIAQETLLRSSGGGAVPNFGINSMSMSSGTTDDNGNLYVGALHANETNAVFDVGTWLFKFAYASDVQQSTLSDEHYFGVSNAFSDETEDNTAAFFPTVGDATAGNVRVDDGGTDTDGTLDYPTLTNLHEYTVLVDYAGNYLNAGHTGFYVDADPREGDDPDVDLAATPSADDFSVRFGAFYLSNGNDHTMTGNHIGLRWRKP